MELMRAFWIGKNHRREVVFACFFLVGGNVLFGQNMAKDGPKMAQNDFSSILRASMAVLILWFFPQVWVMFIHFPYVVELQNRCGTVFGRCFMDLQVDESGMCIYTHISLLIFLDSEIGILMSLPSGTVIWGFGQGRIMPSVMARNTSVVDSTTPADYALYCWVALFSAELAHVN